MKTPYCIYSLGRRKYFDPPYKLWPHRHRRLASQKVLDEITGFARSRHPVEVHCYQWTTSNYKRESIRPPSNSAVYESPFGMLSKVSQHYKIHTPINQNVNGNIGSCQKEKKLNHQRLPLCPQQSSTQTSLWHTHMIAPQKHHCK